MELQETMRGQRLQIVFLGRTNAGKSSLFNCIIGQQTAIVSDQRGTTTDPVSKAMELLPLGPCLFVDTPGLDDETELGKKRINKTKQELRRTDIAMLVIDIRNVLEQVQSKTGVLPVLEQELLLQLRREKIPVVVALSHSACLGEKEGTKLQHCINEKYPDLPVVLVDSISKKGVESLKEVLASMEKQSKEQRPIVSDLLKPGDMVVLVTPIDNAAPKGRLIMPQQQTIRDILDHHGICIVSQPKQLPEIVCQYGQHIKMVITDSQAFSEVNAMVPWEIPLTSFSILFARYKGNLPMLVKGAEAVSCLEEEDKILIAEGCTHKRQCGDIGTVKIPGWLREYTGKQLQIHTCSGMEFPEDVTQYKLVIHCGGCTLQEKEMRYRMELCEKQGVPMVNYGILISYLKGILPRSIAVFSEK